MSDVSTLITDTAPYWIAALIAGVIAAVRYGLPAVARAWDRHRRGIDRDLHRQLVGILSNRACVHLYAPVGEFMDEHDPQQRRPLHHAWISPYARAVKATIRANGRIPRNQRFRARAQIRRAAQCVTVRPLTEEEERRHGTAPEGAPSSDHYAIDLSYDGHGRAEVERIIDPLRRQLHLHALDEDPDADDRDSITLIASRYRIADPLIDMRNGSEWFEAHPADSPRSIPMAVTATGETWSLPTHHTLIYGQTGSGKSGPFLATLRQLAPHVKAGTVKLYGIDPKNDDLGAFADTGIFESMAVTNQAFIDLIEHFWQQMEDRSLAGLRKVAPTTKTPWNILLIDELFDLRRGLKKTREGKDAWDKLERVLSKGRSVGFYVMTATTIADKEEMSALRANMVNRICFRVGSDSAYMAELMLYNGAIKDGYDPIAIPEANAANGYRTAGIAYVMGETGKPLKMRLSYQSEEELRDYLATVLTDERADGGSNGHALPELDPLDELPELEPLEPLGLQSAPALSKRRTPPPTISDDLPDV